ncbi:abortive infection family protein [Rhizobium laguerreae]|uniref:abortive infection family protein n=1 Tax=Rhizobium laguerreae TaxID=1076926 RepID=UPI001C9006AC|nr:abortive infection family protein [Rhizobium laguerreae]MBY3565693.1 abortive infection family protein [Rhizobium laguerreae]
MSADWYPGIRTFCAHWDHAPMLQHTFEALEREFNENSDACIDAAKAVVECACRVIIDNLDNPTSPIKPVEENPAFGAWLSAAVRVLELSEVRDEAFKKLISQHHKLTTTLGDLRNKAGTVSHGKDGFIAKLSVHHRRAALLAADAIVTFLHEAYLERELDAVLSKEPYERFKATNDVIDAYAGLRGEMDEDGKPRLFIVLPGKPPREEIELAAPVSQLLYELDREAYKVVLNACLEADAPAPQDAEIA